MAVTKRVWAKKNCLVLSCTRVVKKLIKEQVQALSRQLCKHGLHARAQCRNSIAVRQLNNINGEEFYSNYGQQKCKT